MPIPISRICENGIQDKGIWGFLFFAFFRAAPVAYGGSQARGLIRVAALAHTTATVTPDPSHICNLHHSLRHPLILNPRSEARDHIEPTSSWILVRFVTRWAAMETPRDFVIKVLSEITLNFPGGPSVIIEVLIRGRQKGQRDKGRCADGSKGQSDVPGSQGMPRSWKRWFSQRDCSSADTLILTPKTHLRLWISRTPRD